MDISTTLSQRQNTHGDFKQGAVISQGLCETLRLGCNWHTLSAAQREALEMMAHKMARIVSGNADFADHWHDIGGYARLAEVLCSDYGIQNAD